MNQRQRDFIAQTAIAMAVCVGGYIVFVEPIRDSIAVERARGVELQTQVNAAESVRDHLPRIVQGLENYSSQARQFAALGETAREERHLFSQVMAAAERNRIQVDHLNPSRPGTTSRGAQGVPARDAAVGYSISAVGEYQHMVRFLRALQTELGFVTIRSVVINAPTPEATQQVRAVIETSHFSFDPAPAARDKSQQTASAGGGGHG